MTGFLWPSALATPLLAVHGYSPGGRGCAVGQHVLFTRELLKFQLDPPDTVLSVKV